jgi:Thioredoxin
MKKIDIKNLYPILNYKEYLNITHDLMAKGEVSTRGTYTGEQMLNYTKNNMQIMARLDDTAKLNQETLSQLAKINQHYTWLVLTEGWCGDAAQIMPVIEKMAAQNPLISHRIILRDEHLDIMDAFLTDEGRSIPKLIVLDEGGNVLGSWGPRPSALHEIVMHQKDKISALPKEERKAYFNIIKAEVQQWYDKDGTASIQREILAVLLNITEA